MAPPKLLDKSSGGQRLDRYELIGEIASGGMATVYLARLAGVGGFQRFVAIKRLHPHLSNEPEFVQMFLDEARLAASIHHPHIVPILEVGTSEAGYYVVMEYVEGDTLARLIARSAGTTQPFPTSVALRVALDTLAGLHAAHELHDEDNRPLQLVHRDVSPQNILVGIDGSARLTDFGVARASSRLASTRSGTLKGKLAYMPPEQAKGGDIDRRADVFAMAIVTWEMLAGKRLFKGESELETLNRLMFEPIPRLRSMQPNISQAVDDVLYRALERDPAKRWATASEFADALERAAHDGMSIASVREVAQYVQGILGTEIQQQRAAVRAWLSLETSQGDKPESLAAIQAGVADATSKLRALAAADATSRLAGERISVIPDARIEGIPASAIPAAMPSSSAGRGSLTAGAMSYPQSLGQPGMDPAPDSFVPPRKRSPIVYIAPLALLTLVAAAVVGWTFSRPDPAATASGAQPSASAAQRAAAAPTTSSPVVAAVTPAASSEPQAAPTSVDTLPDNRPTPAAHGRTGTVGRPHGQAAPPPEKPAEKPAEAPKPADAPKPPSDDYKNPYR